MSGARLARWAVLLIALTASISWSYIAINHLLDSSVNQQDRLSEYNAHPEPVSVHLHQMDLAQQRWGRQSLFSVACSFFFLLSVMMNWVLDGRPRRIGSLK
jgi:hypothetical protein